MIVKRLLAVLASLVLATTLCAAHPTSKSVQPAKGFHGKLYNSVFALYGSSDASDIYNRFVCTVTAYQKVEGGYLLIGAGHCTSANVDELPSDMTYSVSTDLGATLAPVVLLKSVMDEPLDYAVYFLPTKDKYPVIPLGDESEDRIGNKTIDVNFSLGVAKMFSPGVIVSSTVKANTEAKGFFLIDEFDSHGASGSAVVSEKTHKIIGLIIAGWDGETMPSVVEPITSVEAKLSDVDSLLNVAESKPIPVTPATHALDTTISSPVLWFRDNHGHAHGGRVRGGDRGRDRNPDRGDRGHDRGRDGRTFNRDHHNRIDRAHNVRVIGGHEQVFFGGFWFACNYDWPVWVWDGDVYVVMVGPDIYEMYSYDDPNLEVTVYVVE